LGFPGPRKEWEVKKNCAKSILGLRRPCSGHIDQIVADPRTGRNNIRNKAVKTCMNDRTEERQSRDGHVRQYDAITITGQPESPTPTLKGLGQMYCGMAFYVAFGRCKTCQCKEGLIKYEVRSVMLNSSHENKATKCIGQEGNNACQKRDAACKTWYVKAVTFAQNFYGAMRLEIMAQKMTHCAAAKFNAATLKEGKGVDTTKTNTETSHREGNPDSLGEGKEGRRRKKEGWPSLTSMRGTLESKMNKQRKNRCTDYVTSTDYKSWGGCLKRPNAAPLAEDDTFGYFSHNPSSVRFDKTIGHAVPLK